MNKEQECDDFEMTAPRITDCEACGAKGSVMMQSYCGVRVCCECDNHVGLARCYCGWSKSGGDGRAELTEMGETIEEED